MYIYIYKYISVHYRNLNDPSDIVKDMVKDRQVDLRLHRQKAQQLLLSVHVTLQRHAVLTMHLGNA